MGPSKSSSTFSTSRSAGWVIALIGTPRSSPTGICIIAANDVFASTIRPPVSTIVMPIAVSSNTARKRCSLSRQAASASASSLWLSSSSAMRARSRNSAISSAPNSRGSVSITHSVPTRKPVAVVSGMPRYARMPGGPVTSGFSAKRGSCVASGTISGSGFSIATEQNETARSSSREPTPMHALCHWRSWSMSVTVEIAVPNTATAIRVRRSNRSSGAYRAG